MQNEFPNTVIGYDIEAKKCRDLMLKKNADYGDSWRDDRDTTITDIIGHKLKRVKRLEDLRAKGLQPQVSEGIEAELRDIVNYALFRLILESERENEYANLNFYVGNSATLRAGENE